MYWEQFVELEWLELMQRRNDDFHLNISILDTVQSYVTLWRIFFFPSWGSVFKINNSVLCLVWEECLLENSPECTKCVNMPICPRDAESWFLWDCAERIYITRGLEIPYSPAFPGEQGLFFFFSGWKFTFNEDLRNLGRQRELPKENQGEVIKHHLQNHQKCSAAVLPAFF